MSKLDFISDNFNPVGLADVSGIKLMNRVDRKFWFPAEKLELFLEQLIPFYDILEVGNKRIIGYETIYFDTMDNQMYLHHHNGFRDRFKVRRRKYETSAHGFFEIKRKTNKERTIKRRIEAPFHEGSLTETEISFLTENSPYNQLNPTPVLFNRFNRISLASKQKNERCTIDFNLEISNYNKMITLDNIAIIELKQGKLSQSSPLLALLKNSQIRHKGLSKYCTGRALLEPELKSNRFKSRLFHLKKKINNNQLLCIIC